ncbi:MAG: OB-fold domain-containing protein [Acidimicrobiales bacterium]
MRGILAHGTHVPFRRLERSSIADFFGSEGGPGTRAVASFDEDTTSMGAEAARVAARGSATTPDQVWFATTDPAYLDRTNATAIHAVLRLPGSSAAVDMLGSQRSGVAALRTALDGSGTTLVVTSDIRMANPTGAEEAGGGDGAAAIMVGDGDDSEVLATLVGSGVATAEFVDRWRNPGQTRSKGWDDRFSEMQYLPLADQAWKAALADADLTPDDLDVALVTGLHPRSVKRAAGALGVAHVAPDLTDAIGNTGAAHPAVLLSAALDTAEPDQTIALVVLADGAEVLLFRTGAAVGSRRPTRTVATQIDNGGPVSYAKFLSWRGMVVPEPPRRPSPDRPSSSAAARNDDWKFGFVGSQDRQSGAIHMPPARASISDGSVDDMEPIAMADAVGTVVTYTIDKLAYSVNPPIVFAVVDFDGGGRMPIELTDVDPDDVAIGDRVEMTFRRLFVADGISNYFWKGRPVRGS